MDKINLRKEINVTGLKMKTTAEQNAEQVTQFPNFFVLRMSRFECW
jgi:hypothetical protein